MLTAVTACIAACSGSLRIIPEGCKPGVYAGPAPGWRGALTIDLPNPQLYACPGHLVLPSSVPQRA
jgi:hypothetical protein